MSTNDGEELRTLRRDGAVSAEGGDGTRSSMCRRVRPTLCSIISRRVGRELSGVVTHGKRCSSGNGNVDTATGVNAVGDANAASAASLSAGEGVIGVCSGATSGFHLRRVSSTSRSAGLRHSACCTIVSSRRERGRPCSSSDGGDGAAVSVGEFETVEVFVGRDSIRLRSPTKLDELGRGATGVSVVTSGGISDSVSITKAGSYRVSGGERACSGSVSEIHSVVRPIESARSSCDSKSEYGEYVNVTPDGTVLTMSSISSSGAAIDVTTPSPERCTGITVADGEKQLCISSAFASSSGTTVALLRRILKDRKYNHVMRTGTVTASPTQRPMMIEVELSEAPPLDGPARGVPREKEIDEASSVTDSSSRETFSIDASNAAKDRNAGERSMVAFASVRSASTILSDSMRSIPISVVPSGTKSKTVRETGTRNATVMTDGTLRRSSRSRDGAIIRRSLSSDSG